MPTAFAMGFASSALGLVECITEFFISSGQSVVVLSHGITKEGVVPDREIELAILRKQQICLAPDLHTADFQLPE